jgi:hypothetical protein
MPAIVESAPYDEGRPPRQERSGQECPTPSQIVDQHHLAVNLIQDLAEQVAALAYWSESASASKWSLTLHLVADGVRGIGQEMADIASGVDREAAR